MRHWSDHPSAEQLPRDLTRFDPCLLQKLPRLSRRSLGEGGETPAFPTPRPRFEAGEGAPARSGGAG